MPTQSIPSAENTSEAPTRVDAIREALLHGYATDDELAMALHCSRRKLYRLNLPYIKIGAKRLRHVQTCREILTSRSSFGEGTQTQSRRSAAEGIAASAA
jgi:hypothetical protein